MRLFKLVLTTTTVTLVLGALVTPASARNFSVSNQTFRAQFREVRFALPEGTVNCQITLEGSFEERSAPKVRRRRRGRITRAALGTCATGRATILTESLPWDVAYEGFSGRLPSVSWIWELIFSFRIRISNGFFNCLLAAEVEEPVAFVLSSGAGAVTAAELGGTMRSGFECFELRAAVTSDRGAIGVLNAIATRITVTLI